MLVTVGERHGLDFGVKAKFAEDLLGMVAGGGRADLKRFRNPLGALAAGDEPEDLLLPGRNTFKGEAPPEGSIPLLSRRTPSLPSSDWTLPSRTSVSTCRVTS